MSTAVAGDDQFKPGDVVEMDRRNTMGEVRRIRVTVVEPLFSGFYQVLDSEDRHVLMHDPDDNPTKVSIEDTQWIPTVVPKQPIGTVTVPKPPHPPIPAPGTKDPVEFGMSSPDLAVEVAKVIDGLSDRILGTGKDQYEHTDANGVVYQNFETMPLDELIQMTREEVQDQVVYLVMMDIRLRRLQDAMKAKLPPTES